MKPSLVLQKLRSGENVVCFKSNLADARVVEIAALAGFDCIWLDQEHIGQDWSILAAQIWAAQSQNKDTLVRVPRGSYSDYVKPLEMNASGIMVPHVMSPEDAQNVIRMTRFYPLGARAIDGGNADGAYTAADFKQYLKDANQQRFVILQIEDPEPLEQLEEIASLEGFDMLFFGPGDFSQAIGAPGDMDHPKIIAARQRVAEVARKFGKFAGTTGGLGSLSAYQDMGYQFISMGADVIGLSQYCADLMAGFANRNQKGTSTDYYKA
ncbi:HpcH/HpaI aldolase family protein [Cyclobacterium jeungdonense]|uniref:Aldolase/citrate lyase family protein n=1 Tax=Cyclobacterium jeungdonense TaxID=708087 RepID=A0ABT8C9B3_9BACT|nr:aldolase/citrate lyase family protein [Cyclobacterium jeungdonense]MDN3689359.1 aldolase/citrate lyase family protein [Cyclobacterium jeungdonense]